METIPLSPVEVYATELVNNAFDLIEASYGINGESPKLYHNLEHTKDVLAAAQAIGTVALEHGKISSRDLQLLIIAAAYHDVVNGLPGEENEIASAALARKNMEAAGVFTEEDISKVTEVILGTCTQIEDGKLVQAAAKSDSVLTKILADSDLSSLGSPPEVYWKKATGLFNERNPDGSLWDEYLEMQYSILSTHSFLTEEAAELYPHQAENLAFIKAHGVVKSIVKP